MSQHKLDQQRAAFLAINHGDHGVAGWEYCKFGNEARDTLYLRHCLDYLRLSILLGYRLVMLDAIFILVYHLSSQCLTPLCYEA